MQHDAEQQLLEPPLLFCRWSENYKRQNYYHCLFGNFQFNTNSYISRYVGTTNSKILKDPIYESLTKHMKEGGSIGNTGIGNVNSIGLLQNVIDLKK